jgi:disulfide bond formation protein DsbB
MPAYAQTLTYLFAVFTVLLEVFVCMALITRMGMGVWLPESVRGTFERFGLRIAATLGVCAVVLSLWYSEIVGLPVCPLCWFARTMMFPLAVILVVAAVRNDLGVRPYALALAGVGMFITGYHHLYQMGFVEGTLCKAIRDGGDCAQRYIFEFGFVTMPLMGFTLFATVALLVLLSRSK